MLFRSNYCVNMDVREQWDLTSSGFCSEKFSANVVDGTITGDGGDENNNCHNDGNDNEGSDEDEDDGSIHTAVLADVFLAKMIGTYPKPINFSTLICLTMCIAI